MSSSSTIAQFRRANILINMSLRKDGPKSYTRGQGALLRELLEAEGQLTQRELVCKLGCRRSQLKSIVKKAERNGYVTIQDCDEERTYLVLLSELGRELAQKRAAANEAACDKIVDCLSDEEKAQLEALCDKIIVAAKDRGISAKKKGHRMHRHEKKKCCCK